MTLDFKKFIRNCVKKQMQIQHFDCNVQVFKREELPENVVSKLQSVYGQNAVLDGDYWIWCTGNNITKETTETTLFKIVNKALGEAANNMTENEIKMIDLGSSGKTDVPEKTADEVDTMADPEADKANGDAVSDLMSTDTDSDSGIAADDSGDEQVSQDDIDDALTDDSADTDDADADEVTDDELPDDGEDEDTGDEDVNESVESPAAGEKFCFLKITMK